MRLTSASEGRLAAGRVTVRPKPWGWVASSSAGAASGSVLAWASSGWAASPPLVASSSAVSALAMASSVWNPWPSSSAISASMSLL